LKLLIDLEGLLGMFCHYTTQFL